jgi:hypothetical protein
MIASWMASGIALLVPISRTRSASRAACAVCAYRGGREDLAERMGPLAVAGAAGITYSWGYLVGPRKGTGDELREGRA